MKAAGTTRTSYTYGTRPFALFAECILTGVWFTVAALPLVTIPAALAASSRHLAGFLDGTSSSLGDFVRDCRSAWRGGWIVGLAAVGAALALGLNLALLTIEGVPGRSWTALLTMAIAATAASVLLRAATAWGPGASWKALFAGAADEAKEDFSGTGILLGGLLVLVVSTWALWILFVPMSGCVIGAALAVRRRRANTPS
ncbi:hypothetical protein L0U85_05565 [Glycomyces sp. L485]|uniref:hypothetical protein n=1 Tax=Glycomyces sp. L485 TaxID=2909235 RepID=UPI001F4BCB52|nr:hypothetical protein [Glycomyces sp. L485]MCH7230325.1 hypothetical protein [Glycomyces sp. L485]